MRKQFGDYLLQFKDAPIVWRNKAENTKAVILLDDRRDFWLMPILKNWGHFLDESWNFHIVCTDQNYDFVQAELASQYWKVHVHHIKEYFPENPKTLDLPLYIKFYTTPEILSSFREQNFLTMQLDSVLLSPIQPKYLKWKWIGAPCGPEGKGMNGGCTIRNKAAMLRALKERPFNGTEADDLYYPRVMRELGEKLPSIETAVAFAVESVMLDKGTPFGFHGTNKYYCDDGTIVEMLKRAGKPVFKKKKIMIGVPVYKWPPHERFAESVRLCEQDPRFEVSFRSIQGDAHIERARSMLLLQYLTAEKHDWYAMIDSDIQFNGDILWGIINRGKDVIGAAYAFKAAEGQDKYQQPVIRPIHGEQPVDNLVRVRHLGGGFTVVSDDFIRKMTEHYKDLQFMMNPDLLNGESKKITYGLWNPILVDQTNWPRKDDGTCYKEMLSEDYSFCERVWEMGGECWLDLSAYLAHWDGDKCYQLKLATEPPKGG